MVSLQTVLTALFAGIIPAILWLIFWLQEDRKRPEPRGYITATFFAGMVAVVLALPAERFVQQILSSTPVFMVLGWAAIEEILKFGAAWFTGLSSKMMDEPVDGMIYLITAALGFAALENVLFLLEPISESGLMAGIITGNMRFIGATLVHVLSSAAIGTAIALSYYRRKFIKEIDVALGLILAVVLHGVFNLFIMEYNSDTFIVFSVVWLATIGLLYIFEKAKRVHR